MMVKWWAEAGCEDPVRVERPYSAVSRYENLPSRLLKDGKGEIPSGQIERELFGRVGSIFRPESLNLFRGFQNAAQG